MPPADRKKIAKLIGRGRAVTDEQLMASALAYARFHARVCRVLALLTLPGLATEAVNAALGSPDPRVLSAVLSGMWLLAAITSLREAHRCRRGAQATAQASAAR